ncbi:MAG TPA: DNA mismatch repair endonuclease MutL [Methanomicrobiales archaeon]|nr:DNA mismatch repair endonuclease MutL [Methanomicrobiales archaeon]
MAADEGTPTIHLLDASEAMKIAAGEVVERPASVVKELVENSLDAGATRVRVEVTSDPQRITRITVTDDGIGMNRADARLAFLPHATSKIRSLADLAGTFSLGFRGEALASIAAVSQVTLVTRCRGGGCETATRVLARGGEILEVGDAGGPQGTTVVVEDLFYNTPARQKFLKSLPTELAQLTGALEALAISHPSVVLQFLQNGRQRLATRRGPDLLETVRAIFGNEVAGDLIPVAADQPLVRVAGYVSTPFSPRKTPSRILVSINGRPVFSRQILRAIRQGYGTLLPSHTYPTAFLDLRIDPSRVDVNVHPTKRHVRIGKEQEILAVIQDAVREGLSGKDLTPPVRGGESAARITPEPLPSHSPLRAHVGIPEAGTAVQESTPVTARLTDRRLRQTELPTGMATEESRIPDLEVIGQVGGTYILARTRGDDLVLIDQHAAHERILYDQVAGQRDARRISQELLVPVVLRESPREAELLRDMAGLLEERGFLVEEFGKDTFLVRGIPSVLGRLEDASSIQDLLGDIFSGEVDTPEETAEQITRSIACKGAIKAGTACTPEQCRRLVAQLRLTGNPYTCPHGRPTMVSFSRSALDALFKRI